MALGSTATATTREHFDGALAQSIDFVEQFNGGISKLVEALGVTRVKPMSSGMVINRYSKTLKKATTKAGEAELIPLTDVRYQKADPIEMTFEKYRKEVSAESIQAFGYDNAVTETDTVLLKEVRSDIRKAMFTYLSENPTTETAGDFQGAIGKAWGCVQTVFEDDNPNIVAFVNPSDVGEYLGNALVTSSSAFGMTILQGFMGVTLVVNSLVPKGTIYATASENLVFYYIPMNSGNMGSFSFTTDESGYVGIMHDNKNDKLAIETVLAHSNKFIAEKLDGVFKITIDDTANVVVGS